jgi:hypothetical protein
MILSLFRLNLWFGLRRYRMSVILFLQHNLERIRERRQCE